VPEPVPEPEPSEEQRLDQFSPEVLSYTRQVLLRIQRTPQVPYHLRGRAQLRFVLSPTGEILDLRVTRSSGDARLDRLAMDHIRRSAPFPASPNQEDNEFNFEYVTSSRR
jgi:protein TonB